MPAALDTVGKIIDYARILLQDTVGGIDVANPVETYRYPTVQLIDILNMAMQDARRLRPDLFLNTPVEVPFFTTVADLIPMDQQYRLAFVYFIVGHAHFRDEEDTQDARSIIMLQRFSQIMVSPIALTG